MKTLLLSLTCLLGLLAGRTEAGVTHGNYAGSAKTNVKYLDPQTLRTFATGSYGRKLRVKIAPTKSGERNPFTFNMAPSEREDSPEEGEVFAASARVLNFSGREVLLQYWNLQNTSSGFSGTLVNTHSSEGALRERVVALLGGPGGQPRPFFMHDASIGSGLQCRMTAVASGRDLKVTITGYAFVPGRAIIQFTTEFTGRRP